MWSIEQPFTITVPSACSAVLWERHQHCGNTTTEQREHPAFSDTVHVSEWWSIPSHQVHHKQSTVLLCDIHPSDQHGVLLELHIISVYQPDFGPHYQCGGGPEGNGTDPVWSVYFWGDQPQLPHLHRYIYEPVRGCLVHLWEVLRGTAFWCRVHHPQKDNKSLYCWRFPQTEDFITTKNKASWSTVHPRRISTKASTTFQYWKYCDLIWTNKVIYMFWSIEHYLHVFQTIRIIFLCIHTFTCIFTSSLILWSPFQ